MTDTPMPDWVLLEAAKRCEWPTELGLLHQQHRDNQVYAALCNMILKYEQRPVDRKLLCAREARDEDAAADEMWSIDDVIVRAIELYESGFGK